MLLLLLAGGLQNNFNIEIYSASIGHSVFYSKDMTDMDDDNILNEGDIVMLVYYLPE